MKKFLKKIIYCKTIAKLNIYARLFILQKAYEGLGKYAAVLEGGVHPKHRLMKYHQFFVDNVESEDVVLDIGCGNGLLALDIAQKATKIVGIDLNSSNIKQAEERRKKYGYDNVVFRLEDATEIEFDRRFDKIVISNILEHIKERKTFLNKIKKLSSVLLIRVPMINRDWLTLYKKELGLEYRLDRSHYIEYTVESLQTELKEAGFILKQFTVQFGELWGIAQAVTNAEPEGTIITHTKTQRHRDI